MPSKATAAYNYVVQFRRKSYQASGVDFFLKNLRNSNDSDVSKILLFDYFLPNWVAPLTFKFPRACSRASNEIINMAPHYAL